MRRTLDHVTRYRCADVAKSFAKRRAALVEIAKNANATILHDDGEAFHAEWFNCSKERVVYIACRQGFPYVNGPAIVTRFGAVEYVDLLLQK